MRAIFSYGAAAVIVLLVGAWLATGHLVIGGNGAGQGERPIIGLFGGDEHGTPALSTVSEEMLAEAEAKAREAAEAERRATEAAKAAEDARRAATTPVSEDVRKSLTAAAEAASAAAEEARAKAAEATEAAARVAEQAKRAEEAAAEAREKLNAALTIAERREATGEGETRLRSVRTETFVMRPMELEVPLRGRTQASASVDVVAETSGVVNTVHVTKGQRVEANALICTLDQGTRAAAVRQAEAALAQAQSQFDTNARLREQGIAPANSGLPLEAALTAARAALDNARAELDRTEVRTQVAGVVQDPLATPGQLLGPQAPCARVVELDPMLFVGAIPEARIGLARTGLTATIETVTGQTAEGTVSYIAATADNATRSFPVEVSIPNADGEIRDGLTAEATVSLGTVPAHLLPQSILTLDDDGVLGVRAVSAGVVEFYPVTILRDTREGMWVSGLPPRVDIITVGQDFVKAGQKVEATNVATRGDEAAAVEETAS